MGEWNTHPHILNFETRFKKAVSQNDCLNSKEGAPVGIELEARRIPESVWTLCS